MKVKEVIDRVVLIEKLIKDLDREDCQDHLNEWYEGMSEDIETLLKEYRALLLN